MINDTISNMQNVVFKHAYSVFRQKTLPPNCKDLEAEIEAQRFVNLYTTTGRLTDFLLRFTKGAL